jgi:hypothetical protein
VADPLRREPPPRGVSPRPSRRPVLIGLAGAAFAVPLAGVLAGCGDRPPDPLRLMAERALADAKMLEGARAGVTPSATVGARLTELVAARRGHARALTAALGETDTDSVAAPSTAATPAASASALVGLARERLDDSRRQAAGYVLTVPRDQAGLVGSIAACCAAYREVLR